MLDNDGMRLTPRERFCFGNVLGSRKATVALLGVIGALCLLLSACHGEDSAPRPAEPADSGAQSPAEPAGPGPQPPVAPDPGAQPPAEAPDPGHQPPAAATGSAPDPSLVW